MLYRDDYDPYIDDAMYDAEEFYDEMYADIGRRGHDFYDEDIYDDRNWQAEREDYFSYNEGEITPHHAGGSQPKRWWSISGKDKRAEAPLRRRRRDYECDWPTYWKHGRDLPDKWETGDLKNRDEHRDFYRRERRKTRRNRRDSMRFWGADYTPHLGEAHLDAFVA